MHMRFSSKIAQIIASYLPETADGMLQGRERASYGFRAFGLVLVV